MTELLMPPTTQPVNQPVTRRSVAPSVDEPTARARHRDGRDLALQSRRTLGLIDLLDRRPELRGMTTWTEEVAESVLWSA